jgi:hypothetical protein
MGFVEKAKLNVVKRHWIQIGEERERERIIHLLEEMSQDKSGINLRGAISLLKGKYGNLK